MNYTSKYKAPIGADGVYAVKTGKWRTKRPVFDPEKKCIKCGLCFLYCPVFSIYRDSDGNYKIDYEYCKGCGICAHECKQNCIIMQPEGVDSDE